MRLWSRMPDCSFGVLIPIFSPRHFGEHGWLGDETAESPRVVHRVLGPWHSLLVNIQIWPTCTKLVMIWSRLYTPCVLWRRCLPSYAKISPDAMEAGFPNFQRRPKWALFYCFVGDFRILAYKISAFEMCMIWRKPIATCKIQCQSPRVGWLNFSGLNKTIIRHTTGLLHFPWREPVRPASELAYVRSHVRCETSLATVSPIVYKTTQMNMGLKSFVEIQVWN